MRWSRQTVMWVAIAFAAVAFVSLMLALGDREYSFTIGGDDPSSSAPAPADTDGAGVETGDTDQESGLPWVLEEDLPVLAQGTLAVIDQGGPFPFDRDGIVFENREGILPDEPSGHYHEYTVVEPGSLDRGPLRIVTGGLPGQEDEFYWTEDHYQSFERILRRAS